jgi:four helix bundle protein
MYGVALDFIALADEVVEHLPRGRGHLANQLARASTSIVLDLAEGAGKFSKPDKRRYSLVAAGSTTECAAILDVCLRLRLVLAERPCAGKAMLERIAAMLVKVAKAQVQ